MFINDNNTPAQQGCLEKIRNIGEDLQAKLGAAMKDVIAFHTQALDEMAEENRLGLYEGLTPKDYQVILDKKVDALCRKAGANV